MPCAGYGVATQRVRMELAPTGLVAHRLVGIHHSRHWLEFSFAVIAQRLRHTSGSEVIYTRAAFAHSAPADRSAHDRFFGTRVEFDAASDELSFDPDLLERPLRTASRTLADLLETRIREAPQPVPFLDRVRRTLSEMLDVRLADIGELASRARWPYRSGFTIRVSSIDTSGASSGPRRSVSSALAPFRRLLLALLVRLLLTLRGELLPARGEAGIVRLARILCRTIRMGLGLRGLRRFALPAGEHGSCVQGERHEQHLGHAGEWTLVARVCAAIVR